MTTIRQKFSLAGKAALVTGGGRGIGAEIARGLAEMGADIVLTGYERTSVERLAAELSEQGVRVVPFELDVTSESDWQSVIAAVERDFRRLDILVNNAGILFHKTAVDTTLEEFQHLQRVNVDGVFLGCKYAAPLMKKTALSNSRASIINISSSGGLLGMKNLTSYCTSKGAVRLMTKALAAELGQDNIRVNSVHPGVIETEMGDQVKEMIGTSLQLGAAQAEAAVNALNPLQCTGHPEDVAAAVVFLASSASNFMSGSEMVVDGGTTSCR